jgi:hypothetical protein
MSDALAIPQIASLPVEVSALIQSSLELMPGVPASEENLKTLFAHIVKHEVFKVGGAAQCNDLPSVEFFIHRKKGSRLGVRVVDSCKTNHASFIIGPASAFSWQSALFARWYQPNSAGLLEAFVDVKAVLSDLKLRGTCPSCASDEPYMKRRRLLAPGMPKCSSCMFNSILGL